MLRRDDKIALVLSVLIVDQDKHAPVARILEDLVDVGNIVVALQLHRITFADQASYIARQHVYFQIYPVPHVEAAEGGVVRGMRDDIDAKDGAGNIVHRQRNPVQADRTFWRNIGRKWLRDLDIEADGFAFRPFRDDAGDIIHMTGNDMAAQLVTDFQGPFQVDFVADLPTGHGGAGQSFR